MADGSSQSGKQPLSLAFGSFHFQITDSAPIAFTGSQYLEFVRQSLARIAAIGNIEVVTYEEAFESLHWERPGKTPAYSETATPFPHLDLVEIRFNLHVPERVQSTLAQRGLAVPETLGEDFVIEIQDGWQQPNTMVWPVDCASAADASNAVVVVREVLQEEFSRLGDTPVRLECLGPSPAHFTAQLVEESQPQRDDFKEKSHWRNGYHTYTFSYRKELGSPAEVASRFHAEINSELDLHYRIVRARQEQILAWDEIASETQQILEAYRNEGIAGPFKRAMQGSRINQALIALAEFELGQRQELQILQSEFSSTYEKGGETLIRRPVEDMFREFRPVPVAPLSKLLELFDSRRHAGRAVMIATVASLIGAAVAAAATLIAAG